ncbi:DUF3099 domain-containing protein [Microbacterium oryzae]|uniref:DUF3099 domain-containing protein n=1 Tax=Microbacterium oryzae TaxID=743009 RepID=UPI0025B15DF1|nr:DUF3099 domain-containing protein [Microbacterium oryzae]MDN3310700.1 DUF3099 domain-containing protein [Microbacterium oryzae]
MKIRKPQPQAATSLDRAPRDDESHRMRTYLLTMGVRTLCLVLMVVVVPYGWYTFLFAIGAVVLPYIAVVVANAAQSTQVAHAQVPELPALPAAPTHPQPTTPGVIRISESPTTDGPEHDERDDRA